MWNLTDGHPSNSTEAAFLNPQQGRSMNWPATFLACFYPVRDLYIGFPFMGLPSCSKFFVRKTTGYFTW